MHTMDPENNCEIIDCLRHIVCYVSGCDSVGWYESSNDRFVRRSEVA